MTLGWQSRSELRDLQVEFQREKEDLLDIVREQGKQVLDFFLIARALFVDVPLKNFGDPLDLDAIRAPNT